MWISPNLKIPQCRRLDYGRWVLGSLKWEVGVDGGLNLTDWVCRTAMQIDFWSSPNFTTPRTQTQGYGRWALGSWKCELRLDAAPNATKWIYWDPMQIDSQSSPKLKIPPNSNASFQLFGSGSSTCDLGLATETNPTNEKTVRELRGGFLRLRSSLRPKLVTSLILWREDLGASEEVRSRGRWEEGKRGRAGPGRGEKVLGREEASGAGQRKKKGGEQVVWQVEGRAPFATWHACLGPTPTTYLLYQPPCLYHSQDVQLAKKLR